MDGFYRLFICALLIIKLSEFAFFRWNAGSFTSYRDRAFEPSYLFPRAMETDSCSGSASGSVKYVGRINDYVCLGVKKLCVRQ